MPFYKVMLVMLFASFTAHAEDLIRTDAWGKTETEAKHNAFVKAIEHAVGVLMLSDRDTKNYVQVKNDIYAYSDGYITDYKLISSYPEGNGVHVIVDSKVSTSKIKNRILIGGKSSDIDGDLGLVSFNTYSNVKEQSDNLLRKVLLNYPSNAYDINLVGTKIKSSNNREIELDINFSIKLHPDFIKSLVETLDVIENPNIKEYASKVVIDTTEVIQYFNHQKRYYLDDNVTQSVIYKHITPSRTRLSISLENEDIVLYTTCRPVATFVKLSGNKVTFFEGQTTYYATQVSDKKLSEVIGDVTKIQLSMIDIKDCKND